MLQKEVAEANKSLKISIIKENDIIELENIKIEVVHAIHGYQPLLKGAKRGTRKCRIYYR